MVARRSAVAVAVALLAAAPVARADDFLEDPNRREGFLFGIAVGPGGVAGNVADMGDDDQRGGGGSFSIRIGTSAGRSLAWMVQVDSVQFLTGSDTSIENTHSTATVAGKVHVMEALWLKAGIGTAALTEGTADPDETTGTRSRVKSGLGLMFSAGYELVRRGRWTFDIEPVVGVGLYDGGGVGHLALRLSANRY